MAELQRLWTGHTDELVAVGAQVRPLAALAAWVGSLRADEAWLDRLDPRTRTAWQAAVPELVDACGRLDDLGPSPTLVHGDLHPWNVAVDGGAVRVFDWTDAAVSHPFVDLATYVMRADADPMRARLRDVYLSRWADHMSAAELAEAGRLALVVGSLYQVQTYTELIPTLLPADLGSLRDGDLYWARRALTLLGSNISS
jgi:hypothetical protein